MNNQNIDELFKARLFYPEYEKQLLANYFSIMPLNGESKIPRYKGYRNRATMTPEQAYQHWSKYPGDNVGIRTGKESGIIVIDVDRHNPGDHAPEILLANFPELKDTVQVKTPRGRHFYTLLPEGQQVESCIINLEGEKIEIFAGTGSKYHVAAPISRTNGIERMFNRNGSPIIQPTPLGILELMNKHHAQNGHTKTPTKLINFPYPVKDCTQQVANYQPSKAIGERQNNLFFLKVLMERDRLSLDTIKYTLETKNKQFEIPLLPQEVQKILNGKKYWYSCESLKKELPYLDCTKCKRKGLPMDFIQLSSMKNISPEELGFYVKRFIGGYSLQELAEQSNISRRKVQTTIDKVKREYGKKNKLIL